MCINQIIYVVVGKPRRYLQNIIGLQLEEIGMNFNFVPKVYKENKNISKGLQVVA